MKKNLLLLATLFFISQTFGATILKPSKPKASEITVQIGSMGKTINLQKLSTISLKEFEDLSGKKMKLADKIVFKIAQRKLRHSINEDGTINNKRLAEAYTKGFFDAHDFHLGGFLLGFLLSFIGVIIAYCINDDFKSDRRYWAWRGLLAGLLLSLAILGAAGI